MTTRKPQAFAIAPEKPAAAPRAARAIAKAVVTPDEFDVFDAQPAPPPPLKRGFGWKSLLATALGLLLSLAAGLWADALIRDLFARADWLGWLALGLAGLALFALIVILAREALALSRLASVARFQKRAADIATSDDARAGQALARDISAFYNGRASLVKGRAAIDALGDEIIDGGDIVRITETELLGPLDARARVLVSEAARRVSVVTAVSPRALIDVAYVIYESGKLIRAIAELYGGRPGTLGFFRLARSVLAHLAVTGSIAAGDAVIQQVLGHGLAARISARLGEGIVNGMMTARVGVAAMETARPLPFAALKRPGMGDFLTALAASQPKGERKED